MFWHWIRLFGVQLEHRFCENQARLREEARSRGSPGAGTALTSGSCAPCRLRAVTSRFFLGVADLALPVPGLLRVLLLAGSLGVWG